MHWRWVQDCRWASLGLELFEGRWWWQPWAHVGLGRERPLGWWCQFAVLGVSRVICGCTGVAGHL